jgi:hypothetical protein
MREFYFEDEKADSDVEENLIIENKNYLMQEYIKNEENFQKFKASFWMIKDLNEKLENYLCFVKCLLSNSSHLKEETFINSFLKKGFRHFQSSLSQSNNYEYKDLQKYWDILDLLRNCKSGEFNECMIDEEMNHIQKKMDDFLLKQNQMKKSKKNRKNKERLQRQKKRLEDELKEKVLKQKEEKKNVETISLD